MKLYISANFARSECQELQTILHTLIRQKEVLLHQGSLRECWRKHPAQTGVLGLICNCCVQRNNT